jgi:hypothetical protein
MDRVIAGSHSVVKKELTAIVRNMFLDFGVQEIRMSCLDIKEAFFKNKELNYIERVLKDEMKIYPEQHFRYKEKDKLFDTIGEAIEFVKNDKSLEHDLEAEQYIKREGKNQRYTFPKWDTKIEFGKAPEQVPVICKRTGRPYIFKRTDFIGENEDAEVPADIRDALSGPDKFPFNGRSNGPGPRPAEIDYSNTQTAEGPGDDLPF